MVHDFTELRNLSIGIVESVSSSEIKVLLEIDAPQSSAINNGTPILFPKINGFLLIPNETGDLVGIISWIGIEYSQYPKRKGFKEFDLVDLPFPQRKLLLNPLGILKSTSEGYKLERGFYSFPSVGDTVILPTRNQLKSIVENKEDNAKIKIGTSSLAANAPVYVSPDKLFGRHLAVLGNTGSGKSCSVAGLVRWSIEEAKIETEKRLNNKIQNNNINARFIILDPNGEYENTFDDLGKNVRKFKVFIDSEEDNFKQLGVPAWMWNSFEWSSITKASGKIQRPLLRRALREVRSGNLNNNHIRDYLYRYFSSTLISLRSSLNNAPISLSVLPGKQNFGGFIESVKKDVEIFINDTRNVDNRLKSRLQDIRDEIINIINSHPKNQKGFYPAFDISCVTGIIDKINKLSEDIGTLQPYKGPDEDSPIYFNGEDLVNHLEKISIEQSAQQYMDFFLMRIRTMLSDQRMASIVGTENTENEEYFITWLEDYIGKDNAKNGEIVIIDLSLVPSEIIHIIIAVIARVIFEALQRYRRRFGEILPTVLILEEAHNFICKYSQESDDTFPAKMCTQTFERIVREGRKYGLGLVISSQRPFELSPTALSQCNTFLLHRIVNDKDQDLVKRLVPDSLGGLLKELPMLPTRKAILLGWASAIPILVEMNELPKKQQPKSMDPDFWDVWTGKTKREIKWDEIVKEWQR